MKINKTDYIQWKNNNVTVQFIETLQEIRRTIEEQMVQDSIITQPNALLTLNRLSGIREGLDQVLNLTNEDFEDDEA